MSEEITEQKHAGGRPSVYQEKYAEQAYRLTLLGATDAELAEFFGVCERTINYWKEGIPEFLHSIKKGKSPADAEVAVSLFKRAKGYSHEEDRIFIHEGKTIIVKTTKHYPPDTGAAMAWLKNRRPKDWRDTHDFTSGGEKIEPKIISFLDAMEDAKKQEPVNGQELTSTNDNSN